MLTTLADYTQANIIADKIGVEGGYTNNPLDAGGETNYGITAATAARYADVLKAQFSWDGTMRNLTQSMAVYIYIQEYWNKLGLDGIFAVSPLVADLMFEAGINLGVGTVGPWLQTALNVLNNNGATYPDLKVDGQIGPKTASALQSLLKARPTDGLPNVLFMVSAMASARYVDITQRYPTQEVFASGWMNRARLQYNAYVKLLG